jgi:hypothetical protein
MLAGCRQRENVSQLKAINQSLEYSNAIIVDANKMVYEDFKDKLKDPITAAQAQRWMPRAMKIKQYADSIKVLLELVKIDLIKQTDSLKGAKAPVIKELYESNSLGYKIFDKLAALKDSLSAIFNANEFIDNPYLYDRLKKDIGNWRNSLPVLPDYPDSLSTDQRRLYIKKCLKNFFTESSPLMVIVVLNKIESDVLITEKSLIDYFQNQIGVVDGPGFYNVFRAIASLSSSYVKRGQKIEVTAGVGSFSVAARPRIIIDDKEVSLNEEATAVHRFTANGKPGKHSVSIKIEYAKPDGSTATVTKDLEYIIAEEK